MLTNEPTQSKAPSAAAVLGESGLIHGSMAYPVGTRRASELLRLWWRIRRFRPQVLVYLMAPRGERAVRRDAKFFRLCGIQQMFGLPLGDLAENHFDAATDLWEPEAHRLLRSIRPLGDADVADRRNWDLRLSSAEQERAVKELACLGENPFVVVAIGGKMQATDWGTENWQSLLQRLSQLMRGHALVMIGAKDDLAASEVASAHWQGKVLNFCGSLMPRETAAVAARAELFLGRDSGPKYLAAIAGVPCAVVYSARNLPGVWFPSGDKHRNIYHRVECKNCNLEVCVEQRKKCITSITVDEMLQAAMEAWQAGQKTPAASRS